MFKDKQFDYAWCHHVIEHALNPEKACSELMRIAKEGVLYFPTPQVELMCGRYDHKWVVFKIADDHLLFISRYFKPPYSNRHNIPNGNGALLKLEQEPFKWKDKFKVSVIKV
jgi:ubiquinone/menaquinone biosynthesis C-methylase UbiE